MTTDKVNNGANASWEGTERATEILATSPEFAEVAKVTVSGVNSTLYAAQEKRLEAVEKVLDYLGTTKELSGTITQINPMGIGSISYEGFEYYFDFRMMTPGVDFMDLEEGMPVKFTVQRSRHAGVVATITGISVPRLDAAEVLG